MTSQYELIHNHHEQAVFAAVNAGAAAFPELAGSELLADVACVALNRITPRYIRHEVDFAFYLSDKERAEHERAIADAVAFGFDFVRTRVAMRARA
jgi:hypothetical protein